MAGLPPPPSVMQRRIDRLCADFEASWQRGTPTPLESLIDQLPADSQPELLRRLLLVEGQQRQRQGRPLTPPEAQQRFAGLGAWAVAVLGELGLEETSPELRLQVISGPLVGRSFRLAGHT